MHHTHALHQLLILIVFPLSGEGQTQRQSPRWRPGSHRSHRLWFPLWHQPRRQPQIRTISLQTIHGDDRTDGRPPGRDTVQMVHGTDSEGVPCVEGALRSDCDAGVTYDGYGFSMLHRSDDREPPREAVLWEVGERCGHLYDVQSDRFLCGRECVHDFLVWCLPELE